MKPKTWAILSDIHAPYEDKPSLNAVFDFLGKNRIDGVVVFHPLEREQIRQIVDLMLVSATKQMAEKGIKLTVTEPAKDWLGVKGYDEVFGARPLRRTIQDMVEDKLSEDLLRGRFKEGDSVTLDMPEGAEELQMEVEPAKEKVEALAGKKK